MSINWKQIFNISNVKAENNNKEDYHHIARNIALNLLNYPCVYENINAINYAYIINKFANNQRPIDEYQQTRSLTKSISVGPKTPIDFSFKANSSDTKGISGTIYPLEKIIDIIESQLEKGKISLYNLCNINNDLNFNLSNEFIIISGNFKLNSNNEFICNNFSQVVVKISKTCINNKYANFKYEIDNKCVVHLKIWGRWWERDTIPMRIEPLIIARTTD
jgi:hypothetical protein